MYIQAIGDGIADDFGAVQDTIDTVSQNGGGEVCGLSGAVYRCSAAPIIREGVHLNLQGSTLLQVLTDPSSHGLRLKSESSVGRGRVVTESSCSPNVSINTSYHSAISIGPGYGTGGTVASPSEFEGVHDWRVYDLEVSTNKNIQKNGRSYGGVGIGVCGGVSSGIIERVNVPDSAVMNGGIHLDWGYLGPLVMDADAPSVLLQNKNAYFSGMVKTTHPNNIVIRDNRIGRMTKERVADLGGHGIRISGCYGIKVYDNVIKAATFMGIFHHGGDYGFEYSAVPDRLMAMRGTVIERNVIRDAGTYGIHVDSVADNVHRAFLNGYDKIIHPVMTTNLRVANNIIYGAAGANTVGLFAQYINGGRFEENVMVRCANPFSFGSYTSNFYNHRNMGGAETPALL